MWKFWQYKTGNQLNLFYSIVSLSGGFPTQILICHLRGGRWMMEEIQNYIKSYWRYYTSQTQIPKWGHRCRSCHGTCLAFWHVCNETICICQRWQIIMSDHCLKTQDVFCFFNWTFTTPFYSWLKFCLLAEPDIQQENVFL